MYQVNLSGCSFVTDDFLKHLCRCIGPKSKLQVRKIPKSSKNVIEDGIIYMILMGIATTVRTFLTQSLSISGCEALTDSSLHALSSIAKNLKYFDCSGCFRSACDQIMVVMMSRHLQIDIITNIYLRFTGKALKDFTEGSLSLKPESISYCNEIQAKFDDDGEYKFEFVQIGEKGGGNLDKIQRNRSFSSGDLP